MNSEPAIAVVGLGYVGLPLAVALARHYPTLGFDISRGRIAEIRAGRDRTGEVADGVLRIRPDHVVAAMLVGLGAALTRVTKAFQPEGGAYGGHAGPHHAHESAHGGKIHHHHGPDGGHVGLFSLFTC